jgi:hypothetical protein
MPQRPSANPHWQNAGNRTIQIGGNLSRGGVASSGITVVINRAPQRCAGRHG